MFQGIFESLRSGMSAAYIAARKMAIYTFSARVSAQSWIGMHFSLPMGEGHASCQTSPVSLRYASDQGPSFVTYCRVVYWLTVVLDYLQWQTNLVSYQSRPTVITRWIIASCKGHYSQLSAVVNPISCVQHPVSRERTAATYYNLIRHYFRIASRLAFHRTMPLVDSLWPYSGDWANPRYQHSERIPPRGNCLMERSVAR
jgi:hypothetical protein